MTTFAPQKSIGDLLGDDIGIDPSGDPRTKPGAIPSSSDIPSMPKEIRRDASQISKWTIEQINASRGQRQYLERYWIRVESFMEGFHFFDIDPLTGQWRPRPPKVNEVRATVPLIRSIYRRELGRFTENLLTVQGFPRSPNNPMAHYQAKRGELMINAWQEEVDFSDTYADFVGDLLYYSRAFLYRYADSFRKQVYVESWPAWELFPIPWNATKDCQLQGFCRVKLMPKEWIEQNFGKEAARKASYQGTVGPRVGGSSIGNAIGGAFSGKGSEAAEVIWTWLLPTREIPSGQKYIMVGDEMFGYQATDPQGRPITGELAEGKFPGNFCQYTKQKGNWYGMSALAPALGAQMEADRQWSKICRSSRFRHGMAFIKDDAVDTNELFSDDNELIPVNSQAYGEFDNFLKVIPPIPNSGDVGAALNIAMDNGRVASGHESDIIRGQSEGRVESGPLGNILNVNARAPLAPTMQGLWTCLHNTFQGILPMLGRVWPPEKRLSRVGLFNLPQEMTVSKKPPGSDDVILVPSPLIPGGKTEMLNLLFSLRQVKGDDQQPIISGAQFKRSLAAMGAAPPGFEIVSERDMRIAQRLAELFNDGITPGNFWTDAADRAMLMLEDPKELSDAARNMILDPGFRGSASPAVKRAFLELLREIRNGFLVGDGGTGDRYDENLDLEAHDARMMEETIDAVEQNPETLDGQFAPGGVPVDVF